MESVYTPTYTTPSQDKKVDDEDHWGNGGRDWCRSVKKRDRWIWPSLPNLVKVVCADIHDQYRGSEDVLPPPCPDCTRVRTPQNKIRRPWGIKMFTPNFSLKTPCQMNSPQKLYSSVKIFPYLSCPPLFHVVKNIMIPPPPLDWACRSVFDFALKVSRCYYITFLPRSIFEYIGRWLRL